MGLRKFGQGAGKALQGVGKVATDLALAFNNPGALERERQMKQAYEMEQLNRIYQSQQWLTRNSILNQQAQQTTPHQKFLEDMNREDLRLRQNKQEADLYKGIGEYRGMAKPESVPSNIGELRALIEHFGLPQDEAMNRVYPPKGQAGAAPKSTFDADNLLRRRDALMERLHGKTTNVDTGIPNYPIQQRMIPPAAGPERDQLLKELEETNRLLTILEPNYFSKSEISDQEIEELLRGSR